MAKNNTRVRWVSIGLTALIIIAGIITAFLQAQADIEAVNTKADAIVKTSEVMKIEGCLPSRANGNNITRIDTRLDSMQREQRTAFKEILRRLPNE
ncbi:hypothetical protein LCGC14_2221080 [marine sediment metagenome]|uniref:Uncharacterized protein n=1 Tax=marine sediment metagenome TaxID=412755 RepID=A0A0F9DB31_9ZZZZ